MPAPETRATGETAPPVRRPARSPSETGPPLRRPIAQAHAGPVRFGPGVPTGPPEEGPTPGWGAGASARPGRRRRRWSAGLLTLGLVAGVLAYLLLQARDPVAVTGITVSAVAPPGACDVVVDVVGTVATNGRPGNLVYQWLRSDGQTTAPQTQSVASGQTSVPIVLQWSVSGQGRLDARATLRVLEPAPAEGTGGFSYSCS